MSWIKNLILKIAAKKVAKSLDLQEGTAMETKSWYKSRNVWTGIATVLIGAYETAAISLAPQMGWNLPPIPGWVISILGTIGVYTRVVANTAITK